MGAAMLLAHAGSGGGEMGSDVTEQWKKIKAFSKRKTFNRSFSGISPF